MACVIRAALICGGTRDLITTRQGSLVVSQGEVTTTADGSREALEDSLESPEPLEGSWVDG